jgi:hypothetical protein
VSPKRPPILPAARQAASRSSLVVLGRLEPVSADVARIATTKPLLMELLISTAPTCSELLYKRRGRQKSDDLSLQVSLVAGACNQRYLQLWSGVA